MTEPTPWVMPEWMETYRPLIVLFRDKSGEVMGVGREDLEQIVRSDLPDYPEVLAQVRLLERLHKAAIL